MKITLILLIFITALITPPAIAVNRVLSLDGDGDYVEIADSESLNAINSQVTLEAWIKATEFTRDWMPIIYKGDGSKWENRSYTLWLKYDGLLLLYSGPSILQSQIGLIALDTWHHVAGVIDAKSGVMKIFLNGSEIASGDFGRDIKVSSLPLRIGWTHEEDQPVNSSFAGQIDEVRIWNIARTEEEIRKTMHTTLSGKEVGLVGYWRFDDEEDIAVDSSPSHSDGKLIGDANLVEAELPNPSELVIFTPLSGIITDESGQPLPAAGVSLEQNGSVITGTRTDSSGTYRIIVSSVSGLYDLSATKGNLGNWLLGIQLREREHHLLNLTLKEAISIEGTLMMLDDSTPHVAVPVKAMTVRNGEPIRRPIATTFSDERGKYRFINLKPVLYKVLCHIPGGDVYYGVLPSSTSKRATEGEGKTLQVEHGKTLKNIDFRFAPFKKGTWKTYRYLDGLASNDVNVIFQDKEGAIWVGGVDGGVSRYDGKRWKTYTQKDGLANNWVRAITQDREGAMWFGTRGGGVSRFDGKSWKTYTQNDGLASNWVLSITQDREGAIWAGTGDQWIRGGSGVSCFDGVSWKTYTQRDGLASNSVRAITQDKEGAMWFGTSGGVSRYDGKSWITYTQNDGLASNSVRAITQDREGAMWFGGGAVTCFDGVNWITYTQNDGLARNWVRAITQDKEGAMWVGTVSGVSRFDGVSWKTYTQEDGLVGNDVRAILQDEEGAMWFGTNNRGVSRFDRVSWKTYTQKDGLANNWVRAIFQDREGAMWVGTDDGGVSRFDGRNWTTYTQNDGLASNRVWAIFQDREGAMWVGGDGVSRFDGNGWKTYTKKDGLAGNTVGDILQDKEGTIWFGTHGGGVSRFDGKSWETYTKKDGLANDFVHAILQDKEGAIWFGTRGGVSRFDGRSWKTYTQNDGLANNTVNTILQDKDGVIWFGTAWGGVSRFDGRCFQTIDSRDGLADDSVHCVYMDRSGQIWLGTEDGVIQFMPPNKIPPPVYITQVLADEKNYPRPDEHLHLRANVKRVAFDFHAISLKTRPGGMLYYYQLIGQDTDWQGPIREEMVEYFNLKPGGYTFQVQAVDRDLNYSDIANLDITIPPPPFYTRAGFIIGAIFTAFLIPTIIYALLIGRQRRQQVFEPIPNPYIVGNPIRGKEMFFGRQDDFNYIKEKLAEGTKGMVIVFCGERRSGKTSILFQICTGELGDSFVPVLIDMQSMPVRDEGEFFDKLAAEISRGLDGSARAANYDFHAEGKNPAGTFEAFIDDVVATLESKSLLIMFDEYELLEAKIDDGILNRELITFFAGLLERHPNISFIFTGSRHLEQRRREYWQILIGKSTARRITFLTENDTLRLIKEPVRDVVSYQKTAPERIYRLTAGQPFYTQVICQNLVDLLNAEGRHRAFIVDLDKVVTDLAENPLPQMNYFWDDLDLKEQIAFALLGEVLDSPDSYATVDELMKLTASNNLQIGMTDSEMEQVLTSLFAKEILDSERVSEGRKEYRYKADFFRHWVRREHSIWQVLETNE